MARQPLAPPAAPRAAGVTLVALLAVAGCKQDDQPYSGMLDLPVAAAVLDPSQGGPFDQPIGYVADGHGGRIALLELKQGILDLGASKVGFGAYLSDDAASFVRAAPLATGHDRLLTSVAVYAPAADHVDAFAGDANWRQLLRVPHVVGTDDAGHPEYADVTVTDPQFVDLDGSGNAATLDDLSVERGYTSTEHWTVEYDGNVWRVHGSRSGWMEDTAETGVPYRGVERMVGFTIHGDATLGDRFEFDTDSGLQEIDVGGVPEQLSMAPDQSRMAMIVAPDDGDTVLRWLDPSTGTVTGDTALADDSRPARFAWSEDGATLWVADSGRPAVWEVGADGAAVEHAMPWPVADVAPLGRRLWMVPVGHEREVWIWDLDAGAFVDVDAWEPGTQPMDVHQAISGIEAMPLTYRHTETDAEGVALYGRSVAIATDAGRVVWSDETTGCLTRDQYGPRTDVPSNWGGLDYITNFQSTVDLGATLEASGSSGRHAQVNPCAGVAQPETWLLRYDRTISAWRVKGSISGEQKNVAYEDQRYISDDGAVSFVVRSGSTPSADGWTFTFRVDEGVLAANGDNDGDGTRDVDFDIPNDPVFFHYTAGPQGNGWEAVDDRPFVLVAAQSTDLAARVNPDSGKTEVVWR